MSNNIVIIGASSSIGNSIAKNFHNSAGKIIASYFLSDCIAPDDILFPVKLDLRSDKSIEEFAITVKSHMTSINTAIFLSGILPGKNLKEYKDEEIEEVMTVNFSGQARVIKKILPLFALDSQIIMISSISAQRGSYDPIYAASKGAILSFVKSLASSLDGIRVNAIAPGLIEDSTMYNDMSPTRQEHHRQQTSGKRLLSIQDLADVIYDISQDHWKHLNGACIDLNGGQYVR